MLPYMQDDINVGIQPNKQMKPIHVPSFKYYFLLHSTCDWKTTKIPTKEADFKFQVWLIAMQITTISPGNKDLL